jgi:MscS family membrane protein
MRLRARPLALAAFVLLATAPHPARAVPDPPRAQANGGAGGAQQPPAEEVAPDSPRASVKRFLDLCGAGEFAEAASYLDLPDAKKNDGPELARKLRAVLDRQLRGKLDGISPAAAGNPADHMPPGVDEIAAIPAVNGPEPVRLVRRHFPDGTRWLFSRATVDRIEPWYGQLRDRWQHELLPRALLRPGPKDLLWWQWIALPIVFAASLAAGLVLGWLTRLAIARFVPGSETDEARPHRGKRALAARLGPPLSLVWALAGVELAVPYLLLYPNAQAFIDKLTRAGFFFGTVWFVTRCVDVAGARFLERPLTKENPAARSLVPLGTKSIKVVLLIFAVLAGLSELGVAVGSLIAGLGIGGVALALAAQKTMENLFGSFSIGIDQPFRVGDFVTVDTVSGTVESIGLRSTRVRTLDRTLVTFPNGKLADMRVESFAPRDRIKFGCVIPLDRAAKAAQIRTVVEGARALLAAHPKIWPSPTVVFSKIGDASLDVEILAWFTTSSWDEFVALREGVLLNLLELVEKAGTTLATPVPAATAAAVARPR